MTPSTLLQISEAVAIILLGFGSVVFSRRADRQTKSTGNGFAHHVMSALDDITVRLTRLEKKLDGKPDSE